MPQASTDDQLRILDLQAVDTKTMQLGHRKVTHPINARLTELSDQIDDVANSRTTSESALNDLRRELTKAEGDVEQVQQRITRNQSRLDSGQVSAKDAQALVSELESLAHRSQVLEDIQLDVMMRLEAHETALKELVSAHEQLLEARLEVERERDTEFEAIETELEGLVNEREMLSNQIDETFLALYDRLRSRNDGIGAAALRHGKSEASGMEMPASEMDRIKDLPLEEIVFCEETGSILVRISDIKGGK